MKIDPQVVQETATLARLHISEAQLPKYQHDLEQILTFMQQLSQIDTSGVAPLAHPLAIAAPTRVDCVTETNQREQLQQGAPETSDGFYMVPLVVDN